MALVEALSDAGLIEPELDGAVAAASDVTAAVHAFIASTPSFLAVAQIEDLAGERIAVNLPGTDMERPNWRRRIAPSLPALAESATARAILSAIRAAGRASGAGGGG